LTKVYKFVTLLLTTITAFDHDYPHEKLVKESIFASRFTRGCP